MSITDPDLLVEDRRRVRLGEDGMTPRIREELEQLARKLGEVPRVPMTVDQWIQTQVVLTPQYDTSIPEDQRFSKATPSGEVRMMIDNPAAVEYLKPGEQFYVDFTAVPKPEAVTA